MMAALQTMPPGRTAAQLPRDHTRPHQMADVVLRPGERGLLLGMTGEGKSLLADRIMTYARHQWPEQRLVIFDTKPSYRAQWELSGIPTTWRYRNWDTKPTQKGWLVPDSVVIAPNNHAGSAEAQLETAWRHGHSVVVAQVERNRDIPWLSEAMRTAYEHKKKNKPLLLIVDEANHWFGTKRSWGEIIREIARSGRENHVALLLGAQRPRNISVEAIESATNLYWFHTPFDEDIKHLRGMGVPLTARPGHAGSHVFYYFCRLRQARGQCILRPPERHERH